MAGIFTRKAIVSILNTADLTPEERAEQLFSLYGRAIDDGYVTKAAAEAAKNEAVSEAQKNMPEPPKINIKESEEYKALQSDYDAYKARQEARRAEDYKGVKPKFFDAVYDRVDRSEGAKPIAEQMEALKQEFEEYFNPAEEPAAAEPMKPQFGAAVQGTMPTGNEKPSFGDAWGFAPKKK